jgi:hypothetical protein
VGFAHFEVVGVNFRRKGVKDHAENFDGHKYRHRDGEFRDNRTDAAKY